MGVIVVVVLYISLFHTMMFVLQVAVRPDASDQMVAPVTGDSVGLRRAEIHAGVREIVLCKDQNGKMGLRVQAVNKVVMAAVIKQNCANSCCRILCLMELLSYGFTSHSVQNTIKSHVYLSQGRGANYAQIEF